MRKKAQQIHRDKLLHRQRLRKNAMKLNTLEILFKKTYSKNYQNSFPITFLL